MRSRSYESFPRTRESRGMGRASRHGGLCVVLTIPHPCDRREKTLDSRLKLRE